LAEHWTPTFVHELKGLVPTSDYYERFVFKGSRWRALPIVSFSIGQGEIGITPLQLANHTAMLANRGFYFIPHMVREIEGQDIDPRLKDPFLQVSTANITTWL
jgi:penicillin-binding protein 2